MFVGEEKALKERLRELPSWFNFPDVERVEWFNHITTTLWPHVAVYVDRVLRMQVEPTARETLAKYKLYGFKFEQINFGRVPPRSVSGVELIG